MLENAIIVEIGGGRPQISTQLVNLKRSSAYSVLVSAVTGTAAGTSGPSSSLESDCSSREAFLNGVEGEADVCLRAEYTTLGCAG